MTRLNDINSRRDSLQILHRMGLWMTLLRVSRKSERCRPKSILFYIRYSTSLPTTRL